MSVETLPQQKKILRYTLSDPVIAESDTLRSFRDAMLEQHCDWLLEKQDRSVRLYFDAAQVRNCILGMYAYESEFSQRGVRFDLAGFKTRRALVQNLCAAGFLGPVRLLAPHQAELGRLITLRFGVANDPQHRPESFAGEFARAVTEDPDIHLELAVERKEAGSDAKRYQLKHAGAPAERFKVLQSLQGFWRSRLKQLYDDQILLFEEDKAYDLRVAVLDPRFNQLVYELTIHRPDRTNNNISDALAIMALVQMVKRFKDGSLSFVPHYYLASGSKINAVLVHILKQVSLWDDLIYTVTHEDTNSITTYEVCALKTWEYFVCRSAFHKTENLSLAADALNTSDDVASSTLVPATTLNEDEFELAEVVRLLQELTAAREDNERDYQTFLRLLDAQGNKEVNSRVVELFDAIFVDRVLLPYVTNSETDVVEEKLMEASKSFDETNSAVIKKLRAFTESVEEDITRVSRIWRGFRHLSDHVHQRFANTDLDVKDSDVLWRNLGVLQFGLPKEVRQEASKLVGYLIDHDDTRHQVQLSLISKYMKLRFGPKSKSDHKLLGALVVVMYLGEIPELYQEIIDLLNSRTDLTEPWKYFVILLCNYCLNRTREAQRVLNKLDTQFSGKELETQCSVAVGMSVGWIIEAEFRKGESTEGGRKALDRAELYLQRALKYCDPVDELYVYALNVELHWHLLRRYPDMRQMGDIAEALISYQGDPRWAYLYSDTLATMYLFLLKREESREKQLELLELAKKNVEQATVKKPWNIRVFGTLERLRLLERTLVRVQG